MKKPKKAREFWLVPDGVAVNYFVFGSEPMAFWLARMGAIREQVIHVREVLPKKPKGKR